ncbi:MAG: HXXEE domain-containing protein [Vicinamibacterales bacterium]
MPRRVRSAFAALVAAQAAHSLEEYVGRLFDVFAPAHAVSTLIVSDPRAGFVLVNAVLVAFGVWCLLVPLRAGWAMAEPLAWCWTGVEILNGFGHLFIASVRHRYFPGAFTAPLLIIIGFCLAWRLMELVEARERGAAPLRNAESGSTNQERN